MPRNYALLATQKRKALIHTKISFYTILTSIVLGFLGSGGGNFCTVTVSTPSWQTAEMASVLAFSGSTNFLINFPTLLSILTYLTPSFSSSLFLSPLIRSTFSSST
ncbi:17.9 kDa class II heat shock protein-like [Quillaja saponaria]|uniref:17.9 kDa class II heat shock protein-like n=1 Tax=Quillaja saponaria TaxID=32244 RepID=A0AAD7PSK1_QUISA|nr:17.9 kDa class II heat shock protein-like [Quillaja saponaria]